MHPRREVGGEECGDPPDLVGLGQPPQRDQRRVGGPHRRRVDSLGRSRLHELLRPLGHGGTGQDRVDADPVGPELDREALGDSGDRMLRGAVVEQPGAARSDRVDRADVDDRAAVALLAHPPGGRLRAEEHSLDVHRLDAAELLEREAVEQQVGEDAGVVDEHVEPAERLDGGAARGARRPRGR